MKKKLLYAILIGIGTLGMNASRSIPKDFSHFIKDGVCPKVKSFNHSERNVSAFNPFSTPENNESGKLAILLGAPVKKTENHPQEKMDSIVRVSVSGEPVSLQTFTYTTKGQYLRAENFIWENNKGWSLYSYYNYEYDSKGRLLMREEVNPSDPFLNQRYEYGYNDDTDLCSWELFYYPNYDTGDLEPFQKGEYVYDNEGRPIDQTLYYYDDVEKQWLLVGRETVSFDEFGRQTSYFKYIPNETYTELIGDQGEEYIYLGDTDIDAEIDGFIWDEGIWLKYMRHVYTYDQEGKLVKNEFLYWNRASEDWSGNDSFGPYEVLYSNVYTDYHYDADGRLIEVLGYSMNSSGQYVNNSIDSYSYSNSDNGILERIHEQQAMWQGPYLSMFKREVQRFNRHGTETYYKNYSWLSGEERATSEEIRDIDDNNCYHGGVFYGFTNDVANTRYGQAKEEFGYPEDWNHVDETPSYGKHWKGTGYDSDDSWVEESMDEFVWHDVYLIGNTHFIWEDSIKYTYSAYLFSYDYNVMANDIWAWPLTREKAPYKILTCEQYYDMDLDEEWDEFGYNASYIDRYCYSDINSISANEFISDCSAEETERFDISGNRLSAPSKGINIVRYSDGSVRKVIVK